MRRSALALLFVLSCALFACGDGGTPTGADADRVDVRIDGLVIDAEVARTPEARQRGLGGRDSLDRDEGMLFVFPQAGRHTFWMRGMRFPLDFIWIGSDRTVVEITPDAPPPPPGAPDSELELYTPAAPVRYVLEVNAGLAQEAGVRVGDAVTFDPSP